MDRPDPDEDELSHAHLFPANLDRGVLEAEEKRMIVDIIKEVSSRVSPRWRLNFRIRHHARQAVIAYINGLRDADLREYHETTFLDQFNVSPPQAHSSRSRSRSPTARNTWDLHLNGPLSPDSIKEDKPLSQIEEGPEISASARGSHQPPTASEPLSARLTRTCLK